MAKRMQFWGMLVIAIVGLYSGIAYWANTNLISEKQSISVAVSLTPLSAPFYVAESINAFDDTCVSVAIVDVIGGKRAFEQVMSGKVDFATSSDSVIAYQSLHGGAFVTHGVFVESDNDVKLISRISANVSNISDLIGLKIGVTKGTASEYFLTTLLALEGLSIDKVELFNFPPEALPLALENKVVDAIVPWEPYGFVTKQNFTENIKIHETKNLNTLSFNLLSKTLKSNTQVNSAKCLLEGLVKATEFIATNTEEAKHIVKTKLNIQQEFIDWVWQDYIFKVGLDNALLLSLESQALWAAQQVTNEKAKKPEVIKFIDARALMQVAPQAVQINWFGQ